MKAQTIRETVAESRELGRRVRIASQQLRALMEASAKLRAESRRIRGARIVNQQRADATLGASEAVAVEPVS